MFSLSSTSVWEFALLYLHCSASPPKLQAPQGCLLSNNAKCTTKVYWISSNLRQIGGVLELVSKVHGKQNQYHSWQRALDIVLFARWLIGQGVNSLSIHHGHLHVAVSQAVPKTSSSWEAWLGEMDGWSETEGVEKVWEEDKWALEQLDILSYRWVSRTVWMLQSKAWFPLHLKRPTCICPPPQGSCFGSNCLLFNIYLLFFPEKTSSLHTKQLLGELT